MKILKYLILAVVITVVAAAVWLLFFFDANQFKPEIQKAAYEQTGRELKIEGDINLKLWPPVSLQLTKAEFANEQGFSKQPMAKIGELNVVADLLKLLSNQLVIKKLVVNDVNVLLEKNRQGKSNWESLAAKQPQAETDSHSSTEKDTETKATEINISSININNVNLEYRDAQQSQSSSVSGLNIKTGQIQQGKPVDVTMSLLVNNQSPKLAADINASANVDWSTEKTALTGLVLKTVINSKELFPNEVSLGLETDALISNNNTNIVLNKLKIALDDSTFNGDAAVNLQNQTPSITLNLTGDSIDLRRYISGEETGETSESNQAATQQADTKIDTAWTKSANADFKLKIAKVITEGFTGSNINLEAKLKNALLTINDLSLQAFDGSLKTSGSFDGRNTTPAIAANVVASSVDLAEVQQGLMGEVYGTGTANITTNITARGKTTKAIQQNLNGSGNIQVANGGIKRVNVTAWLRTIQALLKKQPVEETGQAKDTDFAEITASYVIENGVLKNNDLHGAAPGIRLRGNGSLNIADQTIDYYLIPSIVETSQGSGGESRDDLKGIDVPRHCKGSIANPECKFKLDDVLKDKAKEKANKKLDKLIDDKLGDKAPVVKDIFKKLF